MGTPDGDFGNRTQAAVQMLQEHFFAGGVGIKRQIEWILKRRS